MSSKITIWNGEWWICNPELENNPKIQGKLTCTEDGSIELKLYPNFDKNEFFDYKWATNYIIWGFAHYMQITLFKANIKEKNPHLIRICAKYAFIGKHLTSLSTPCFKKVSVEYTNLKEFATFTRIDYDEDADNITISLSKDSESKKYLVSVDDNTNWCFYSTSKISFSHNFHNVQMTHDTIFSIVSKENQSLCFFQKHILEFTDFLSLALYSKQRPKIITFREEDKSQPYQLLFKIEPSAQVYHRLIGNSVPHKHLHLVMKNWHIHYDEISPIYKYLERSSFDIKGVSGIPEFLLIEFAIEGYFKRYHNKIKTNNKDIQQCKDELNQLLKYYAGVDLIKNLNLDVDSIVATRDTYVHLRPEIEQKENELRDAHDIWVATEKLKILLLCCLLDNMGFTIEEIDTNFKAAPILHPEQYQNEFLFE